MYNNLFMLRYQACKLVYTKHPELEFISMSEKANVYCLLFWTPCDFKAKQLIQVSIDKKQLEIYSNKNDLNKWIISGSVDYIFSNYPHKKWVYTHNYWVLENEPFSVHKLVKGIECGYKLYPLKWEHFDVSKINTVAVIQALMKIGCKISFISQQHESKTGEFTMFTLEAKYKKKFVSLVAHLRNESKTKCIILNMQGGKHKQYNFASFNDKDAVYVANMVKNF